MTDIINHPFIKELERFDYVEGNLRDVMLNGVNEIESEESYFHNTIKPLENDFFIADLPNLIAQLLQSGNNQIIKEVLFTLKAKIESIVNKIDSNSTIQSWKSELSHFDFRKSNDKERYYILKFLNGVINVQRSLASGAIDKITNTLDLFSNSKRVQQKTIQEEVAIQEVTPAKPLYFNVLGEFSAHKEKSVTTSLRNDLIDLGYLSKEDPNNTLANFRKLFLYKGEKPNNEEILQIKWYGNQTELKYFIYLITDSYIEPNYTSHSNYNIAFQVFVDKDGQHFKPKEVRYKDKPSTSEKLEKLLGSFVI